MAILLVNESSTCGYLYAWDIQNVESLTEWWAVHAKKVNKHCPLNVKLIEISNTKHTL